MDEASSRLYGAGEGLSAGFMRDSGSYRVAPRLNVVQVFGDASRESPGSSSPRSSCSGESGASSEMLSLDETLEQENAPWISRKGGLLKFVTGPCVLAEDRAFRGLSIFSIVASVFGEDAVQDARKFYDAREKEGFSQGERERVTVADVTSDFAVPVVHDSVEKAALATGTRAHVVRRALHSRAPLKNFHVWFTDAPRPEDEWVSLREHLGLEEAPVPKWWDQARELREKRLIRNQRRVERGTMRCDFLETLMNRRYVRRHRATWAADVERSQKAPDLGLTAPLGMSHLAIDDSSGVW